VLGLIFLDQTTMDVHEMNGCCWTFAWFSIGKCLEIWKKCFSNYVGMSAQMLKSIKLAVILSQSK